MDIIKPITSDDFSIEISLKRSFLDLKNRQLKIDQQSIEYDGKEMYCKDVKDIRYGVTQVRVNGINTSRNYEIVLRDRRGDKIKIFFTTAFGIKKDQIENVYGMILDSLWYAATARLLDDMYQELWKGENVTVGHVDITPLGLKFTTGFWRWKKDRFIAWESCTKSVSDGRIWLNSTTEKKANTSLALLTDWNAVTLYSLLKLN